MDSYYLTKANCNWLKPLRDYPVGTNSCCFAPPEKELVILEKKINSIIERKRLARPCKLVTDFLDDEVAIATLAKCELLVFPYQNTKESASGAVRMGVASGVPIAVSPIPIFDDVNGAIRMRGGSVDDIVASISMLSEEDLDNSNGDCRIERFSSVGRSR